MARLFRLNGGGLQFGLGALYSQMLVLLTGAGRLCAYCIVRTRSQSGPWEGQHLLVAFPNSFYDYFIRQFGCDHTDDLLARLRLC